MNFKQIILVLLVCVSCKKEGLVDKTTTLPYYSTNDFTPQWISPNSDGYDKIHTIAPFSLTNQDGKVITNKEFKGKIYVADFFFTTCPSICPILAKNMLAIQDKYASDETIKLISHSVMPWVDSVAVLKEYAINKKVISDKWHLLTGDRDEIYNLARTSYFADEDFVKTKDESEFIHTENVLLIDKKGRIRGVYNGTLALETKRLIRHIEILRKED
jgi:protein SCO1/2